MEIKLTQFSKGSGCGCKIAPAVLEQLLGCAEPAQLFPDLLVGIETRDDAAVLDLGDSRCLISTTDFFTPLVDDPYDFGRIASANALSDVYAMGGKPCLALAILGFPVDKLPVEMAARIIEGARNMCKLAGIPLAGGHSINSSEPFFGLAVNGFVNKSNLKKNTSAIEGDLLFLSKPVGTGILSTAVKKGSISSESLALLVNSATQLNSLGSEIASYPEVHAMTDVTGFGLLGHLMEMCQGSGVSAELFENSVPVFPGLSDYTAGFVLPDNTFKNWQAYEKKVSGVNGSSFITLCDPQTSGGLLISLDANSWEHFKTLDPIFENPIGRILPLRDAVITVHEGKSFIEK